MRMKAQIFSLDMIFGLIVFILIIVGLISIFLFGSFTKSVDKYDYERDYLYRNLERNLAQLSGNMTFLQNSRVDVIKLQDFAMAYRNQSINDFVVGNVSKARGIGLDPAAYDVCLYFTDNDKSIVQLGGIKYLGTVDGGSCDSVIGGGSNPCNGYKDVISMFKPVLFDARNPNLSRIIQMNLVVCRR